MKVVVVGETKTGKTTWFDPTSEGHPTMYFNVFKQRGHNIFDIAGNDKFAGLRDGYFDGMDAMILFSKRNQLAEQIVKWNNMASEVKQDYKLAIVLSDAETTDNTLSGVFPYNTSVEDVLSYLENN